MALQKEFTNQSGITASLWLITSVQVNRMPETGSFDHKVIFELYPDREKFNKGYASLARRALHITANEILNLEDIYLESKKPVFVEKKSIVEVEENGSLVETETTEQIDTNYFTDATDVIEPIIL